MQIGIKVQGRSAIKAVVMRHGHKRGLSRRSYAAAEKAIETAVRQAGRRACQDRE